MNPQRWLKPGYKILRATVDASDAIINQVWAEHLALDGHERQLSARESRERGIEDVDEVVQFTFMPGHDILDTDAVYAPSGKAYLIDRIDNPHQEGITFKVDGYRNTEVAHLDGNY